jgi:hypothetical protein
VAALSGDISSPGNTGGGGGSGSPGGSGSQNKAPTYTYWNTITIRGRSELTLDRASLPIAEAIPPAPPKANPPAGDAGGNALTPAPSPAAPGADGHDPRPGVNTYGSPTSDVASGPPAGVGGPRSGTPSGNGASIAAASDEVLKALKKQRGVGPCFYRALLAAAELYVGKPLTDEQIDDAGKELKKGKNKYGTNVFGKDWSIAGEDGPNRIIEYALRKLGNEKAKVDTSFIKMPGAQYSIRKWDSHKNLGDSNGNLLWEPYSFQGKDPYTGKAPQLLWIHVFEE